MQIALSDAVTLSGVRRTKDGYLVGEARIARTGIQLYTAGEIGLTDRAPGDVVRVYRPESEIFAEDAMASYANRPITMDHPPEMVTADNWKRYAIGDVGSEVMRDGDFVKVPFKIMDAAAIAQIESGKRELSAGYTCELEMSDGIAPDGQAYDAIQRTPRQNHVAVCSVARGGSALRIGDKSGDSRVAIKTITFDGLPVEVTDAAEAIINKLTARVADADKAAGAAAVAIEAKDGEIAALNAKLADAAITPEKLAGLVAARAATVADAQRVAPTVTIADSATDAEIRRTAVEARLGDTAKDMSDAAIEGAFAALAKDGAAPAADLLRAALSDGVVNMGDAKARADAARAARNADLANGYKGKAA
jgi:hypothetical protein